MSVHKQLLAYPIIDEIEYASEIDSSKLNQMLSSIEQSILRCIIRSNNLSSKERVPSFIFSNLRPSKFSFDFLIKDIAIQTSMTNTNINK